MKIYKVTDLMKRYNVTRQAINSFIKKNLEELNATGTHARKKAGEWTFDEEAVRIMDDLRDTGNITIIEEDSERVQELIAENEQLKQLLIATQNKLISTKDELEIKQSQIIAIQNELLTTQKQLNSREIEIENNRQQLASNKLDLEGKKRLLEELKEAKKALNDANATINNLRQRSLFDRLFNR